MDEILRYIRLFSPQKDEQAILIYGSQYHLWFRGEYLGVATWTEDFFIGDSFQTRDLLENKLLQRLYFPDEWELIVKKQKRCA